MKKIGLIIAFMLVITASFGQTQMKDHYLFPQNLAMSLVPQGGNSKKIPTRLTGVVEGRLGILSHLRIYFESSDDFQIKPEKIIVERLKPGERKEFSLELAPVIGKPSEFGSWARLRVQYLPDYGKLREYFSDVRKFPNDGERNRILSIIAANLKKAARQVDATRFFLKTE